MMKSSSLSAVAFLALTSTSGVEAFTMMPSTATASTTSLNLLPNQGKQLEAALNAQLAKAELEKELCEFEGECTEEEIPAPTPLSQSARAFVSRVFSLPSAVKEGFLEEFLPESFLEEKESSFEWNDSPEDDVVLFPLVGFQFVNDAPNHYGVLPSPQACNPSCRLRTDGEEELVGWFSQACHLDWNEDNYGEAPVTESQED